MSKAQDRLDFFGGQEAKKHGQMRDIWRRLARNKLAMFGMVVVIVLVLCAVFADVIAPYSYSAQDLNNTFARPSLTHLFGTDAYGRDILTRVIYGGRISLLVAIIAIAIGLVIGGVLGLIAGFLGGWYDGVVMRLMDIMMTIPGFLLSVCVSSALGPGVVQTAIAVSIGNIPGYARLMRALVMTIRDQEYIEAARVCGERNFGIMLKEVLPNTLSPIIVETTLKIGACILMISGLSFIGLGVQPPQCEWGSMLSEGRRYILQHGHLVLFPGLAIMATLFGFNLFGDGLRDALDPRLKS